MLTPANGRKTGAGMKSGNTAARGDEGARPDWRGSRDGPARTARDRREQHRDPEAPADHVNTRINESAFRSPPPVHEEVLASATVRPALANCEET